MDYLEQRKGPTGLRIFSKWENDGTPVARKRSVNTRFVFNEKKEYFNNFRRHLEENIMSFHPRAQVWKSKLKYWPGPSKVGYVIYCADNIKMIDMITNVLEFIEKENGYNIEIVVQMEAAFQTNSEKNYTTKLTIDTTKNIACI